MAILWVETDPWGHQITLTDERWQHIEAKHPEMIGQGQELRDTIREPHLVYEDPNDPLKDNFYRLCWTRWGRLYVRAVVVRTASPFIITAHLVGVPLRGGRMKWIKK